MADDTSAQQNRFELEPGTGIQPSIDRRPRMAEPLPVNLVAVEDVRLPAPAGVECELDAFYVGLLGFERVEPLTELIYTAENLRLRFTVEERPVEHDALRPLGIEVSSLAEAEEKLIAAEMEYARQKGLTPGHESLVLQDPAGNWIELVERRRVM